MKARSLWPEYWSGQFDFGGTPSNKRECCPWARKVLELHATWHHTNPGDRGVESIRMRDPQNDRARHENLAQRIEPTSTWGDIVLGEQQIRVLRELSAAAVQVLQGSEDRQSEIKSSPEL